MKWSEKVSKKVSAYIKEMLVGKTDDDLAIMEYGFQILLINIPKLIIYLSIAYCLNLFKEVAYIIAIFSVLRYFAAGIHARTSFSCLASTSFIIFFTAYIGLTFRITTGIKLLMLFPLLYIFYRYAPADTENKPYLDVVVRRRLKIKSMLTVSIYFIFSFFIRDTFCSNSLIYIVLWEAILINPITYKLFKRRYDNYEYYEETI